MKQKNNQSILILYHFSYPDGNVSAKHFFDIATFLSERQWAVEVLTSNRSRAGNSSFKSQDQIRGVKITRSWRPNLNQEINIFRIINSVFLILKWSIDLSFRSKLPEHIILGSDPVFLFLIAPIIKMKSPKSRIYYWCLDLYPDAIFADGILAEKSYLGKFMVWLKRFSLKRIDKIITLGECMEQRLTKYTNETEKFERIFPWAFLEPEICPEKELSTISQEFSDKPVKLLYSGSVGRAHSLSGLKKMLLNGNLQDLISMRFAVPQKSVSILEESGLLNFCDVELLDYVPSEKLIQRFVSPDLHVILLKDRWNGIVLPSKLFASLAVGQPVLFIGPKRSHAALIIEQSGLGWVIDNTTDNMVFNDVLNTVKNEDELKEMRLRCFNTYRNHYSSEKMLTKWLNVLER